METTDRIEKNINREIVCPHCGSKNDVDRIICWSCNESIRPNNSTEERLKEESKVWFYCQKGNGDRGPLATHELRGFISGETMVWKSGMEAWKKACDVPELADVLYSQKPILPSMAISDKWVWLITLFVYGSMLFQYFFGETEFVLFVYCILGIPSLILVFVDLDEIMRSGRKVSLWIELSALFVTPLYIFIRAIKYTKRYGVVFPWVLLVAQLVKAVIGLSLGSELSIEELSENVKQSIIEEYEKNEDTHGFFDVKDIKLHQAESNNYNGIVTLWHKKDEEEIKLDIQVVCKEGMMQWKLHEPK
jgi:hypothetical protein